MVSLLMIFQAHYSIDCPIGVICACYAFLLIKGKEERLDDRMRSFIMDPFRKYLGFYFDTETLPELKKIQALEEDEEYHNEV